MLVKKRRTSMRIEREITNKGMRFQRSDQPSLEPQLMMSAGTFVGVALLLSDSFKIVTTQQETDVG